MLDGLGVISKAAFRKASEQASWPSGGAYGFPAIVPGAGHGIPLLSEGFTTVPEREDYASLYSRVGKMAGQQTGIRHSGHLLCQGMYNNLDRLIGCAMGYENPNDPGATYKGSPESGGGKYTHIYELDDILSEQDWDSPAERLASGAGGGGTWVAADDKVRFGNVVIYKGLTSSGEWCFYPVMFDKMIISGNFDRVTVRFDGPAYDHERATSTYGHASWTMASDETHLILPDSEFYIGTVDGTTLTWQEMGITGFELVLENGLEFEPDTKSGLYIPEPRRGNFRQVYGGFDFSRYENDDLISRLNDDDEMKAWIKFSSGSYKFNIYLPSFHFKTMDYSIGGPGIIRPKHTFECHVPDSDPFTGDADYLNIELKKIKEFWVAIKNDYSSNFLTEEA